MILFFVFVVLIAILLFVMYAMYRRVLDGENPKGIKKGHELAERFKKYRVSIMRNVKAVNDAKSIIYETSAYDGTKLSGYYYPIRENAPLMLFFHGYKSNSDLERAAVYKLCCDIGCNLFAVCQRGHKGSGGKTITFGVKERRDVLSWVDFLSEKDDTQNIFLYGISMGGATVLMASDMKFPEKVKGIISDCAYNSPKQIFKSVAKSRNIACRIFIPLFYLSAFIFGHFNALKYSAVKSVSAARLPILVIHGENDTLVPFKMGEEIYKSCVSEKYYLGVPGAKHATSIYTDNRGYTKAVKEFINKYNCSYK